MVQPLVETLLLALLAAIAFIALLISIGSLIGFREEIRRRHVYLYGKVVIGPILIGIYLYFYIQGVIDSSLVIMFIMWVLPVLFCTDWKKVREKKASEYEHETPYNIEGLF